MSSQTMHTCEKCGILFSEETLLKVQRVRGEFDLCRVCFREKKQPREYCAYCGRFCFATRDHVVPQCREKCFFANARDRIFLPACGACNESKGKKTLSEWFATLSPADTIRRARVAALIADPALAGYV